jgi:hypothetical protein
MSITVVRRLYQYAAAFLGLQLCATGLRGLLTQLLEPLFATAAIGAASTDAFRLSLNIALLLVGLPLWALHWWLVQRAAHAHDEQHARLRRLYAYLTLGVAAIACLIGLSALLGALLGGLLWSGADTRAAGSTGALLVYGAIWLYHWRVFATDRNEVEVTGGSATLRRWYLTVVLSISLFALVLAAIGVVRELLLATQPAFGVSPGLRMRAGELLAALLLWLPHQLWWRRLPREATPLRADELRSALRQVYLGLAVTITAVAALGGLAGLLYQALLAGFGGALWSALLNDQADAIATALVAAPLWLFHRAELAAEAHLSDMPARPAMARRLIGYLMAAIGLVALFFGLGGLLGTLIRMVAAPQTFGLGWREPLSMYAALALVALPVYATTAQATERLARGTAAEERTLSRRIYLYAALLFGIGASVTALVQLLRLALAAALGAATPNLAAELGGWAGYTLIGAALLAYYAWLVRRAGKAKSTLGAGMTIVVLADEPLRAALLTALTHELPGAMVRSPDAGPTLDLTGADLLVAALGAALKEPTAGALRAFAGRRLLLATPAPGYELAGARSADAVVREAAHSARAVASERDAQPGAAQVSAPVAAGA